MPAQSLRQSERFSGPIRFNGTDISIDGFGESLVSESDLHGNESASVIQHSGVNRRLTNGGSVIINTASVDHSSAVSAATRTVTHIDGSGVARV